MQNYVDRARAHSKRKQYSDAIKSFEKAIARAPTAQLFDERAECYVQLGNLEAALKDAKASIQHASSDPVGYLRAGNLLQSMNKKEVALEVMSHGLRRVKQVGQIYETLREAHEQLLSELAPHNSLDPLTVLPRELASIILDHLSFRQLVAVMRVSQGWNKYIRSCPDLWQHLNFTSARRKVRVSAVKEYIKIADGRVVQATLGNMADFDASLNLLLRRTALETLTISNAAPKLGRPFLQVLTRSTTLRSLHLTKQDPIEPAAVREFVHSCSQRLRSLTIALLGLTPSPFDDAEFPSLIELSITHCLHSAGVASAGRPFSVGSVKGLQSLRFHSPISASQSLFDGIAKLECLKHLDLAISGSSLRDLRLPPTIEALCLSSSFGSGIVLHQPDEPVYDLPRLKYLKLETNNTVDPRAVEHKFLHVQLPGASALSHLKMLHLARCQLATDPSGEHLKSMLSHARVRALESLVTEDVANWTDENMATTAVCLQSLTHLTVSGSYTLTGVGVRAVLKHDKLKRLHITACDRVSPDAVAWARSRLGTGFVYRRSRE